MTAGVKILKQLPGFSLPREGSRRKRKIGFEMEPILPGKKNGLLLCKSCFATAHDAWKPETRKTKTWKIRKRKRYAGGT